MVESPFQSLPIVPSASAQTPISPDGKILAYEKDNTLVMRIIGEGRDIMLDRGKGCQPQSFAPDSRYLAVVCQKNELPKVLLLDLFSKSIPVQIITSEKTEITALAWSPDGKKIAYVDLLPPIPGEVQNDPIYIMDTTCLKDPQTCQDRAWIMGKSTHSFYFSTIVWAADSENISNSRWIP